jgi:hypothetical protein
MDLVAFRDSDGRIGLLDEYFPHRRLAFFEARSQLDAHRRAIGLGDLAHQ